MNYLLNYNEHASLSSKLYISMSFIALFLLYCFSNYDVLFSLGYVWYYTGSYNFSYIVLLIVFTWVIINILNTIVSKDGKFSPSLGPILGVFLCISCAFITFLLQLAILTQTFTILTLWFLSYACLGRDFAYSNLKPLILFATTIPFLRVYVYYEIDLISKVLALIFENLGILQDSYSLKLETSNVNVFINKTYSGLRYLNVALVLSIIYGFCCLSKVSRRIILIVFSFFTTVVLNFIRVAAVTIYSHYYHAFNINNIIIFTGWLTFLIIILLVFSLGYFLKCEGSQKKTGFKYRYTQFNDVLFSQKIRIILSIVSIAFLLLQFNYVKNSYIEVISSMPTPNAIQKPLLNANWQGCSYCKPENWHPKIGKPDAKLAMTYINNISHSSVDLYIGYYEHQYVGNSLTSLGNVFLYDKSWYLKKTNVKTFSIKSLSLVDQLQHVNLQKVAVNRVLLEQKNGSGNRVIWYWFSINGYNTNNPVYAKYLELIDVLQTFRTHSSLIAVSSEYKSNEELAQSELTLLNFLNDNYSNLQPKPKRRAVMV